MMFLALVPGVIVLAADGPSAVDPDQAEVVDGNNAFAVDLYAQLKSQQGNLFFSPERISTALAMTYAGARGDTAAEMAKTLHFTLPPKKLHPAMAALLRDRNAVHGGYELKAANALWGQQGYAFLDDFLTMTRDNYGAGLNQADFKGATEDARLTINSWVEQQTENKIKELLQPGLLTKETRLVLTNAIYFKGDWQTQFKKEDTKDQDFHVSAAQNVKTPLMHMTKGFNYFDGSTFQALEIPYKDKKLSMIIFLPNDVDGLPAFEQLLTADKSQQWLGQLQPCPEVIVTMPKFKMEAQFGLKEVLIAMGMGQAFDIRAADFTGIMSREVMQRDGNLSISAVVHKADVDVNEEGTEASAATAVVSISKKVKTATPPPPIFRADHPFLFLIRDNRSGSILFMGRVTDPTE